MDTVTRYREIVQRLIEEYARYKPSHGEIDTEIVIDPARNHYELLHIGFDGPRRVHGTVLHVDIRDEKIWIQYDGTDRPLAEELVRAGVPREAVVLAFYPPEVRPHTDFGI
ncbi:MAG TPA: XisI protein [Kofleriaceae bacterium]